MRLSQAQDSVKYRIKQVHANDLASMYLRFGLVPGEELLIRCRAPIFGDPLLIETESGQYALTKSEAWHIEVEKQDVAVRVDS